MTIHQDFIGGNISVEKQVGQDVFLKNELRDTTEDWFYWAFCIEGAAGQTLTFHFEDNRLGYFGPAVSRDLENWDWLNSGDDNTFTYTFGADENRMYFAHHTLYHPARFIDFASRRGLTVDTLCTSEKGRAVPCVTFGEGDRHIILTSRHHACESPGTYVLQGVLETLLEAPAFGYTVLCVPFVDYDGVVDGDQGKARAPHDHNRDYLGTDSLYATTRAIQDYIAQNNVVWGFDFHAPWHRGEKNDKGFFVQPEKWVLPLANRLAELLEEALTPDAFRYEKAEDFPPDFAWNISGMPCFSTGILNGGGKLGISLETAYFGKSDNRFTPARGLELGRCFGCALLNFLAEQA